MGARPTLSTIRKCAGCISAIILVSETGPRRNFHLKRRSRLTEPLKKAIFGPVGFPSPPTSGVGWFPSGAKPEFRVRHGIVGQSIPAPKPKSGDDSAADAVDPAPADDSCRTQPVHRPGSGKEPPARDV